MKTIPELQSEISKLESEMFATTKTLNGLRRELLNAESLAFISTKKITKADVEMSSGDDRPWFGTIYEFGDWLKTTACKKVWAEWNGRIYHTTDLINHRMPEMPGCTNDLCCHPHSNNTILRLYHEFYEKLKTSRRRRN